MDTHTLRLFAAVLLSVIGCSSDDLLPPGPLTGEVGGIITFKTTISSAGPNPLTIAWTFRPVKDSLPVSVIGSGPGGNTPGSGYNGRVSVDRVTGSLELTQLTLRDSGVYSVTLTSNAGASKTAETTLEVYEPVSSVTVRANATDLVEFNDTVELTCSALGSSLFYRWHNGSSDITTSERVHLSDDNRILIISRVLRSDRGPLSCTVSNVISNGTNPPGFLNISFGPDNVEVTVDPLKEFHTQGSTVTLSCSAQSSPPAEFKWAFNGTMLNTKGQELKLENIQENQSGSYTCWAHNIKTQRFTSSDPLLISLIEKISGASITGPTEVLIAGNSSAKLSCQTTAGTIISRKWLKDGRPLSPSNRIAFSGDNSSVSIDPLQGTDNGKYQCILTNPVSTNFASYDLTVNYGPEDVVIKGRSEIEVGHTVVLTCSASSVPPATFTWTLNGTETAVMTEEYTVEIAAFSNSGNYTCVAKNSVTGYNMSSVPHVLTLKEPNSGSQVGAILGGIFGAVACVTVAGGAFVYVKKKKRSSSTTIQRGGGNTSNQQSNGGDVTYADVSHFRKADGSNIQLGSVKAQATPETGPVDVGIQESPYSEVKKN